jgi:glycosyltransferase involved in cell wall biosynthesis
MLEPWARKHKRWKKWPYFILFERRHLQQAASLLATSELEAGNLRRFFPNTPIAVIALGLPEEQVPDYAGARARLQWNPDEKVLLFLSRIHPKKGLELLLKALSNLPHTDFGKVRLVVVGDGESSYVRIVRALDESLKGSLPRVDWVGPVWGDKKWCYLQGADLFCLPSYSENFGLAILEALQVGTPVLTTNQGPWEFLREWNAGYVVDATAVGVQASLTEFFAAPTWNEQARRDLAEKTRGKFGWETVGPQYLALYRRLIGSADL